MIEKLFREESLCENGSYQKISTQVVETLNHLTAQLREEDKRLVQRLCDCYIEREEIVKNLAYQEGFRVAVVLASDIEMLFK